MQQNKQDDKTQLIERSPTDKEIDIFVKNSSFEVYGKEIGINVFICNASFEEYKDEVDDFID